VPAASGEKYILVDLSEQHLYAYEGSTLVYSFVASTGMHNATSVGVFHIQDKIDNAYGATWNILDAELDGHLLCGRLENGIHACRSYRTVRGCGRLPGHADFVRCIVLGVQEAQELYDWADVGTTVEIQR